MKLTLSDLANLANQTTAVATINANNTLIEAALENTLSLDGTEPNSMDATLDMNSYPIINVPTPATSHHAVNKAYVDGLIDGTQEFIQDNNTTPEAIGGAVGDRTTVDTTALQTTINSFGSGGGTTTLGQRYLTGSLDLKPNVQLKGVVGRPEQQVVGSEYYRLNGQLCLSTGATVTMDKGSCIDGVTVTRNGQTQAPANDAACTTLISQFAGTGIAAPEYGTTIRNSLIVGHNVAVTHNGGADSGRFYMEDVNIDCLSGVQIDTDYDVVRLKNVHCWPFMTAHVTGVSTTNLLRAGGAFAFSTRADWMSADDCFAYGYVKGFILNGVSNCTLRRCQVDTASSAHTTHGFHITGATEYARLENCTSIGPANSIVQDTTDSFSSTTVISGLFVATNAVFNIADGDLYSFGSTLEGSSGTPCTYGVFVGPGAGNIILNSPVFNYCTNGIYFDASWTGYAVIIAPQFNNVTTKYTIPAAVRDRVIIIGGNPADMPAWATYTPTASAASGTFTSAAAAARYDVQGKTVRLSGNLAITTNGTAATTAQVSLPFTAGSTVYNGIGRDEIGNPLQVTIGAGATIASINSITNTYPGGSGKNLTFSITYERN